MTVGEGVVLEEDQVANPELVFACLPFLAGVELLKVRRLPGDPDVLGQYFIASALV